ncbi:microsomal signal peptidase 25 kDa subunit-domain-containing protein [Durotheca rogersii]|uniref:microsomal signal peptidase 25 kDa subunit-domain-containing protein n=1 Tax=Durotheca rogersii TaxID=419775 RepID=UPI0022204968|nr:microsomal signal peptidase 25 kDa subunit-domain-containing protein [Durotheca rogersii]KAI5862657.1 microsomal signal peptidase 25 kDa subunit-domain-containing protein [Durotheca rogersii]
MASQERISVHNLADLKNTSDDAIPNYLNSLGFRQDHRLVDTRLALGYGAFAVAAACFAWDYQLGFEATKRYTAAAVGLYALLNAVLTYWVAYVERGVVYQGRARDGSKISIATSTQKNIPTYHLKITVTPPPASPQAPRPPPQTLELARSFAEWFDVQGRFVAPPFQTALASSVPLIGAAHPERAAQALAPELLDAIASASASTGATTASPKKSASKRRKA